MRENRIGVDLDGKNRFRLLKAYFNALNLGEVIVSETRRGYHLRILKRVPVEKALEIRRYLGDDVERLGYDELKLEMGLIEWVDTLFEIKKDVDGKITREKRINPLAEPFWSKIVRRR